MTSLAELKRRISPIVSKCSSFKIGETSQHPDDRLAQHSGFDYIEAITYSKYKRDIDYYEAAMIAEFINHPKCMNKKAGSASRMPTTDYYYLYVVYNK